jgi:DNA-binding NtrC family response regulator
MRRLAEEACDLIKVTYDPKPFVLNLKEAMKALHQAGIEVSPAFFENMDMDAGFFMKRFEGNKSKTSKLLGISRATLREKIRRYQLKEDLGS